MFIKICVHNGGDNTVCVVVSMFVDHGHYITYICMYYITYVSRDKMPILTKKGISYVNKEQ